MKLTYYLANYIHKVYLESEGVRMAFISLAIIMLAIVTLVIVLAGFFLINKQLTILETQTENTKILGKTFETLIERRSPKNANIQNIDSLAFKKTNY